jgi:hypothetical protein
MCCAIELSLPDYGIGGKSWKRGGALDSWVVDNRVVNDKLDSVGEVIWSDEEDLIDE